MLKIPCTENVLLLQKASTVVCETKNIINKGNFIKKQKEVQITLENCISMDFSNLDFRRKIWRNL